MLFDIASKALEDTIEGLNPLNVSVVSVKLLVVVDEAYGKRLTYPCTLEAHGFRCTVHCREYL